MNYDLVLFGFGFVLFCFDLYGLVLVLVLFWFLSCWSSVGFELWIEFAPGEHKLNPFGNACLSVFE